MNKSRKIGSAKSIISVILSFLIFVFMTALVILGCLYFTLFQAQTALTAVDKSDYCIGLANDYKENAWDITIPLGLPRSIVDDLVTTEQIRTDIDIVINGYYGLSEAKIDTSSIGDMLDSRVKNHFLSQGKKLTANQETVLLDYRETLEQQYINLTNIPVVRYLGLIKTAYKKLIFICSVALLILLVISIIFIIAIRRYKHRALRYLAYSTISTAVVTLAIPIVAKFYTKINLSPVYFRNFVINYLDQIFFLILLCGLAFALLTLLILLSISILRKHIIKATAKHEELRHDQEKEILPLILTESKLHIENISEGEADADDKSECKEKTASKDGVRFKDSYKMRH